jgi:hypothetical protein
MVRHVWSVLCSSASIDAETGSVSLFNLLDQITVFTQKADEITLPMRFEIFSMWTFEEDDPNKLGKARVMFCNPSQICFKQVELGIELGSASFHRTRIRFEGLKINGPGNYQFSVEFCPENDDDFIQVASLPLFINYQSPPEEYPS